MPDRRCRLLALLFVTVLLAPGTWLREPAPPVINAVDLRFRPLALPPRRELARHLGAFDLAGAWEMTSRYSRFGGYSALLVVDDGRFLAISDRGNWLNFLPPGVTGQPPRAGRTFRWVKGRNQYLHDSESATRDPATGRIWLGWEQNNTITRHDRDLREYQSIRPPAMRDWGGNTGAEAMVRLADGRFIVLSEGFTGWLENRRHPALLFAGDPLATADPTRLTFVGPENFSPTDMAQLPDGRVLILMRRLAWPFPARFAGRIAIADPRAIRPGRPWPGKQVAMLSSSLPVDNFEAMAITPGADGRVNVWLLSDANSGVTQRTLLWKLTVDPRRLP